MEETKKGRCGVLFSCLLQKNGEKGSAPAPHVCLAGCTVRNAGKVQENCTIHRTQQKRTSVSTVRGALVKAGRVRAISCGR